MHTQLDELLSRWQEEPHRAPEDLCRDHPDLLPLLREQIAMLKRIEQLVDALRDPDPYFTHSPP